MLFSLTHDGNPPCPKCGSESTSISTVVKAGERYVTVDVCEGCLFKTVLGEELFAKEVEKALEKTKSDGKWIPVTGEWIDMRPPRWWEFWR